MEQKIDQAQCGNCIFFVKIEGDQKGECRRNPPNLFLLTTPGNFGVMQREIVQACPRPFPNFWCGEYRAAPLAIEKSNATKN